MLSATLQQGLDGYDLGAKIRALRLKKKSPAKSLMLPVMALATTPRATRAAAATCSSRSSPRRRSRPRRRRSA